ncbi:membrane protein insertase YidC [Campylobacter taeniopygiae]|uniref:membrane protein insertase YidC n=1 Tax=Campylobacter taeniopygiae TaxID=2510188 RepID=UPI003D6A9499
MNNTNNFFQQKRVLLAVVLSFLFFIVYDYFFIPKNPPKLNQNITKVETNSQFNAPKHNAQPVEIQENALQNQIIADVKSDHFEAKIDALGRISSFYLKDKKYQNENGEFINLVPKNSFPYPLEMRFGDEAINAEAFKTPYSSDLKELFVDENGSKAIKLTQKLSSGLIVEKNITFYPLGNYKIEVSLNKNSHYFISPGSRPDVAVDTYTVHGALAMNDKETIHTFEDGKVDKEENMQNIWMISAFDRYYATFFYNFEKPLSATIGKDTHENPLVFASSDNKFEAGGYIGSKEHAILESIDPRLEAVVEYGWFTFIAKPMFVFLNFLHNHIGNWGWSIVVMVLIIRLILFPLTYKSMISMNKLKDLAPKMKELRERYKGDPQKMNIHMMELYKKHGANPMSGCLPILLQIPIFFAIYRVLLNAIELKAAPWIFWIHDLSVMDPYFVLPILMGVTMFVQQLVTPMTIQDPMQAKIMKFLPVIFTFFFVTFPAGLTLYWFVNNLCSFIQQLIINKIFAKEHHKK